VVTSEDMTVYIAKAMQSSFHEQFQINILGLIEGTDKLYLEMGKVLGAKLKLSSSSSFYEFCLFVPVALARIAVSSLLGEQFDDEDPEVWESVGEFLNIISGSLCNQINDKSEPKFELQCPVFFPRMQKFDKGCLEKSCSKVFSSSLGTIVFGYQKIATERVTNESRC
jgi:hypothetical protein